MSLKNFVHIYKNNSAEKTLVLLHGTGADEYDLLPLVDDLSDEYNFLSLRGNVDENGMKRFFKRKGMGVFDEESIKTEAEKLKAFIQTWKRKHDLNDSQIAWLGYSNGANMILAETFLYPETVQKAVLLHSMLPLEPDPKTDLSGKEFLVTCGLQDQMIRADQSLAVKKVLEELKAEVVFESHPGGHELRPNEVEALKNFLD